MSAKSRQMESQLGSLLREENIVESRPITPPCRNVVGGPISNGLLVLQPDTCSGNVQFNSAAVTITYQTNKRHGSADRIQRKLRSVERSNSAGGRLTDERNVDHSGVLEESIKHEPVQKESKTSQSSPKKTDVKSASIPQQMSNGNSEETVKDINNSLDNLHVNQNLPIELKAEFLSCVMEKNYEKALHLCNEMLVIDPENKTCVEFQIVIKEKLEQGTSSDEDSEEDGSGTDTDNNNNDSDESGDDDEDGEDDDDDGDDEDDDGDDDESSDDDDEEEESESSSDSDIELPVGPINILMGGLPLRPSSAQSNDQSEST